ncbi:MAG: helix-turn-helix transcriptional regulator, partial [Halofilum sp. (in: g-proteobacteria)]
MGTEDYDEPVIEAGPERRPGEELGRAREQAGIDLRTMAETLHLPENQLRALEADDYASLPPPTFVRGYLRSYARVLGLDDDEIVGAYDGLGSASSDPQLYLSGGREATAHRRGLALALTALALAVAVSVGAWWWQSRATSSPVDPLAAETQADDAGRTEPADDSADDSSDQFGGGAADASVTASASADSDVED